MDINDLRSATTVLSLVVFLGIVWWAYRRGSKEFYDDAANLPFAENDDADVGKNSRPR